MQKDRFKALLDQHHDWPCEYSFKFVVPKSSIQLLKERLAEPDLACLESKKGNYCSLTLKRRVESSVEVVGIYERVADVPGLILL